MVGIQISSEKRERKDIIVNYTHIIEATEETKIFKFQATHT